MFWNRRCKRRTSLKTKVTLWYALLFFFSSLLIFLLLSAVSANYLITNGDGAVLNSAEEIEKHYFLGRRLNRPGDFLPLSELPEEAAHLLEKRYPKLQMLYLCRTEDETRTFFTVYGLMDGCCWELQPGEKEIRAIRKLNAAENLATLKQMLRRQLSLAGGANLFYQLCDDGKFLYDSFRKTKDRPPLWLPEQDGWRFSNLKVGPVHYRVLYYRFADGKLLLIGRNQDHIYLLIREIRLIFLLLSVCFTVVSGGIGYLLSRRFLKGLQHLTSKIDEIASGGDYSSRLGSADVDWELQELIDRFNCLNSRTDKLMKELRMVTDNVAHDLRTPLTRMSGTLELVLSKPHEKDEYVECCLNAAEECARMRTLVNTILEISRSNSDPATLQRSELDLCEMLQEACELLLPAAEELGIKLSLQLPETPVRVSADRRTLPRVITNLVDNAFKFTPSGGRVSLSLTETSTDYLLKVADTGCGIAPADQERVFERFYSSDRSRARGGFGLGLPFVKSIVRAHNWGLHLESAPGKGSVFTLFIPKTQQKT